MSKICQWLCYHGQGKLLRINQQALLEYERQGLVEPQHTPNGTRRYSEEDVARLLRIQQLTSEGASLGVVRYVVGIEEQLRTAHDRVRQLEEGDLVQAQAASQEQAPRVYTQGNDAAVIDAAGRVILSTSLVIVHVPTCPRSPRWRNQDWS